MTVCKLEMFCLALVLLGIGALVETATVINSSERKVKDQLNEEPVIGILAQEMSYSLAAKYEEDFESYIAASYVKFIEGAGARVVPIWINKPRSYYESLLPLLNGVLLPGGATWFNQSNGYADAGRHIYDVALQLNYDGNHFPIWGTCLGFELLTYLALNGTEHRAHCSSNNQGLPLKFQANFRDSRLFGSAPDEIVEILANEPVTPNFHQYCTTQENFTAFNLDHDWRVMSTNLDWNGLQFISSIEHKTLPFYGVQFHPEKNIYEWVRNKNISHTPNAIKAAQYFADFFVDEARRSDQHFSSPSDLDRHVIYNFPTYFTGLKNSAFEQCYLFREQRYLQRKKTKCIKQKVSSQCGKH
ncbi:gamma-glutamyl hydrolase-like [Sabethes cyaneus]|uniref:gamma-glutamyl hydrolase-like n=1 Tax=Sabethes cyaneus TaxID=53552 RepID=UPI00237D34BB|nr:gamma-glutamyl hydrolase-like [Sabethes cyaneus]XP_053684708.1 gamma-glutamyl hydrolase-like [Sabethes cyaneus]XP_053684709.1 gamma-glutamyl hydrolase-like [Sabethes cyaneus]